MIKMGSKKVICNLYVCVFIYCFAELEPSSPVALAMEVEYDEDDNDVVMFEVQYQHFSYSLQKCIGHSVCVCVCGGIVELNEIMHT